MTSYWKKGKGWQLKGGGVDENFFRGDRNFAYTNGLCMNLIFLESSDPPESVEPKII